MKKNGELWDSRSINELGKRGYTFVKPIMHSTHITKCRDELYNSIITETGLISDQRLSFYAMTFSVIKCIHDTQYLFRDDSEWFYYDETEKPILGENIVLNNSYTKDATLLPIKITYQ